MVTNYRGAMVLYYEGTLTDWNAPVASGGGTKYSSNERWGELFGKWPPNRPLPNPFDPDKADQMELEVNLSTGQVTGTGFKFQATCENRVLYGFNEPDGLLGIQYMFVLALLPIFYAPPY